MLTNGSKNNKVVKSTIPPLEEIILQIQNKIITASPFKMDIIDSKGDPTNKDINKIQKHNNLQINDLCSI